jgi:hypothetical protein
MTKIKVHYIGKEWKPIKLSLFSGCLNTFVTSEYTNINIQVCGISSNHFFLNLITS